VIPDSVRILRHLEASRPDPPLFPRDPARRAELEVFLDWFNRVWKLAPNAIEAELESDAFSAADCAAFPFLKYARLRDPEDDELFHRILEEQLALGGAYPRVAAWIERVDERPRA
jgi:glutathione S-transferase